MKRRRLELFNETIVINIVLIFYLSNNLLQDIFNGHRARNLSIFIHHQGHMVAVGTKFFQQNIQSFTFWNHRGRTNKVFNIKALAFFF